MKKNERKTAKIIWLGLVFALLLWRNTQLYDNDDDSPHRLRLFDFDVDAERARSTATTMSLTHRTKYAKLRESTDIITHKNRVEIVFLHFVSQFY